MAGATGFFAVTPLQLADGSVVLVQRGWVPRDMVDRARIVAPPRPPGRCRCWAVWPRRWGGCTSSTRRPAARSGRIWTSRVLRVRPVLPLRPVAVVQEDGDKPPQTVCSASGPPSADVQKALRLCLPVVCAQRADRRLYVWFQLIRPGGAGAAA
jgi:surfeit locus 1 family protein